MSSKIRYSEFKDRINIDAVYESIGFSPIARDGDNDIGHCLFPENHTNGDSTGKFAIHREKMVYNCWVCGGGDLLSLVMELNGWETDAATEFLYQFSQHDLRSDSEFTRYLLDLLSDNEETKAKAPYFNPNVLGRYIGSLDYFLGRGIGLDVIDEYQLKYADRIQKMSPHKTVDGIRTKVFEDYYGPCAIFPHYWRGKLVGWQQRWINHGIDTPRWLPKYTNTSDFPKSTTLFNYDKALKRSHEQHEPVIVVESVPTVLFLETYGIPAVSSFGAEANESQLRLLRKFHEGVTLAPDLDDAGEKNYQLNKDYLIRFVPVYRLDPPDFGPKSDVGDFAGTDDPELNLLEHLSQNTHRIGVEL